MNATKWSTIVQRTTLIVSFIVSLARCQEQEFNPGLIRTFSIKSTASDATYVINVALPADYDVSSEFYHTIYLLDGEENFDFVADHSDEVSRRHGVQNAVVVSICWGRDRSLDYTPTRVSDNTGGASEFLTLI